MSEIDRTAQRRPTIYDLAQLAGTSASAVSPILNGSWKKRRISQSLAERVTRIAEEQGYSVNIQASVLRRVRSNIVGMIMPKYDNRYFGAIAEQFEALARDRGMFPVITCTQRDPALEVEAAKELLSYQVDCLISTGATDPDRISALCAAAGVRTINLDLPGRAAPSVISDNYGGARLLAAHILEACARDLGDTGPLVFVGGRASDHNTAARIQGFLDAHADRGIPVPAEYVLACGYAAAKAEKALAGFGAPPRPGFFVNSTITLEGVVRWMDGLAPETRRRMRYGCFDWDPFAALLPRNVGMIRQDVAGMLDVLFRMIDTPPEDTPTVLVPCLLERL